MKIVANGQDLEVREGSTVAEMLAEVGYADRKVAVELNMKIVPRAKHKQVVLAEGDRLEVVTLVGGG
jgi:sulfur carrier protein